MLLYSLSDGPPAIRSSWLARLDGPCPSPLSRILSLAANGDRVSVSPRRQRASRTPSPRERRFTVPVPAAERMTRGEPAGLRAAALTAGEGRFVAYTSAFPLQAGGFSPLRGESAGIELRAGDSRKSLVARRRKVPGTPMNGILSLSLCVR